jgi:hypothetical protein
MINNLKTTFVIVPLLFSLFQASPAEGVGFTFGGSRGQRMSQEDDLDITDEKLQYINVERELINQLMLVKGLFHSSQSISFTIDEIDDLAGDKDKIVVFEKALRELFLKNSKHPEERMCQIRGFVDMAEQTLSNGDTYNRPVRL